MPMPLIPNISLFRRKLAGFPIATYQAGETVVDVGSVALAIHFADAPAGGTAGVSSHAFTIHEMGTACFADRNDQGVWLEEGCG